VILLLLGGLVVICGVAMVWVFRFMARASSAETPAAFLKWLAYAGGAVVVVLLASHPLWEVFEQFCVNFGGPPPAPSAIPPIVLAYIVWGVALAIRRTLRRG
jgi:hypothetical protein